MSATNPAIRLRAVLLDRPEVRLLPAKQRGQAGHYLLCVTLQQPGDSLAYTAQLCIGEACPSTYMVASARAAKLRKGCEVRVAAAGFRLTRIGHGPNRRDALQLIGVSDIDPLVSLPHEHFAIAA